MEFAVLHDDAVARQAAAIRAVWPQPKTRPGEFSHVKTSLTIVLPTHNSEATLRSSVARVLEVAGELTPRFEVLIVDDGSTDDTYDIAAELALQFRQVSVLRSGVRRGLGAAMRDARRHADGRVVIVHDGVSTINADELRTLYLGADEEVSLEDLRRPATTHKAMVQAHSRLKGFQRLASGDLRTTSRREPAAAEPQVGLGAIPPLPKPNFLGAVGDFALGE